MSKDTYLTVREYQSREEAVGVVIKLIAIIASIYGMCRSCQNLMAFTYFTNLSNIFMDMVLFGFMVRGIRKIRHGGKAAPVSNGWYVIKFMATISITLTFFVYLTILAPTNPNGFVGAYLINGGGSLCVHVINPLLSILDFILFDYHYESGKHHVFYALVPPLVYLLSIVLLASQGMRWGDNMYAPYNFINFGAPTGWFGFDLSLMGNTTLGIGVAYMIALLLIIFAFIGTIFLAIKNLRKKHKAF